MQPLRLYLKPSQYLARIALIGWVFLLMLCLLVQLPWWQTLAFAMVSFCQLIIWLRHYAWLQTANSLKCIQVTVSGWQVTLANGIGYNVQLASGCRFVPGMIVLRFSLPNRRVLWWLLLADSADAKALRRLRVWGRWGP